MENKNLLEKLKKLSEKEISLSMLCKELNLNAYEILALAAELRKEGINILAIKEANINGSETRSESISADITGNTLTITFNDNVGIAHIVIKDSNGVYIDRENVFSTPDYATFNTRT